MAFPAFLLRVQAGAARQLNLVAALRAAEADDVPSHPYCAALLARLGPVQPTFALKQSVD